MRKIKKIYEVYNYSELNDKAKESVRNWYLKGQDPSFFEEICLEQLKNIFPESDLNVQFSLGYCQGDGFNIYGEIQFSDILDNIADDFTEKELKYLSWAINEYDSIYRMQENHNYSYCICSRNDFTKSIIEDMEYDCIRAIRYELWDKFNKLVGVLLDNLCKKFENQGYDFFYEIEDDELQEFCEAGDYEFYENGELYIA